MITESLLVLASGGLISGVLAGLLGIGGGTILVPLLVTLGYTPVQAVATSSLAIIIIAVSGSFYNWRKGYFDLKRVVSLAIPALLTAQIGVYLANQIPSYILLLVFGLFLLTNIYLVDLRKRLIYQGSNLHKMQPLNPVISRISTGGIAGVLAGLLGGGGGSIMVPLQMLLLGEPIKVAIQTSLGVIVCTVVSACVVHASEGNVLFAQGIILGSGGLLGAQLSTRTLPKLPDTIVSRIFRLFLALLSVYMLWQAWLNYAGS